MKKVVEVMEKKHLAKEAEIERRRAERRRRKEEEDERLEQERKRKSWRFW